jgi:DNA invertase Pin-like site-specific DNA recombinase
MKQSASNAMEDAQVSKRVPAIAYYRSSSERQQEECIASQQVHVRAWADKNGVEIIREFWDVGKPGNFCEERPAFDEMMDEWVTKRTDFAYILCLDVSRWGRFQDLDLSAQFSAQCKKHRKQVIYTSIGKPREDDPLYPVYVQFERFRSAQYRRELSDKVWRGCVKIVEQGYWAGGSPPYATQRLLLDEKREPLQKLNPGQRKGIQNQRVTLVEGDPAQVATIQRIFHEFVENGHSEYKIAEGLNQDGVLSPGGRRWGAGSVLSRIRNETYLGTLLYNKTSKKLKTPSVHNPVEKWIRTPDAFEGIISDELFARAQEILEERRRKYDPDRMLNQLQLLYKQFGMTRSSLTRTQEDMLPASSYSRQFGSWDKAFQQLHKEHLQRARELVHERLCKQVPDVLAYSDFYVLDRKLSVAIQPAVPIPTGYTAYWPIEPDSRNVIDITVGVLLSDPTELEILGYIVLPRGLAGSEAWRISSTSVRTELFGRTDLAFLKSFL